LQVADKAAIKEMTASLHPLVKALGQARKVFLSPLTRYWLKPFCDDTSHHLNYSSPTYLPAQGASVFRLRDNIRDCLFTCRTSNFRVVCSNKLLGIGPHLSDEMARDVSRMWGGDPVHPLPEAYDTLACAIESDILTDGSVTSTLRRLRVGYQLKRTRWTSAFLDRAGSTAALQRLLEETPTGRTAATTPEEVGVGVLLTRKRAEATEGNSRGREAAVGAGKSENLLESIVRSCQFK
jgi:hypothetical protein